MKRNSCNKMAGMAALLLTFGVLIMACNGKAEAQSSTGDNPAAALKEAAGEVKNAAASAGGNAASALKAFQQTVQQNGKAAPDVDAIVKAAQSMSAEAIAQLTRQNGSPSGDFAYDLSEDGKGIVIRKYTKNPADAVVIVPETIEDIPVTEIGDAEDSSSVTIYGDNLVAVVLPATITRIGDRAFDGSKNLASVNFPAGLKSIGDEAFLRTALTSVNLPEGLETLGSGAFGGCSKLTSITLPGSLKTIPRDTFWGAGITEMVIPEGVEAIGAGAFKNCKNLLRVTLPSTIKEIRGEFVGGAFANCSELTDIIIPDSVTSIRWRDEDGRDKYYNGSVDFKVFERCGKLKLAVRQRLKSLGYGGEL